MHPVIQLQGTNGDGTLFSFVVFWVVLFALAEFILLYRVLARADFDTLNRILWVIVIIGAPLIGPVLYLIAAPTARPEATSPRSQIARRGDDLSGTPWADDPGYTRPS